MLDFIERFKLDRDEVRRLPNNVEQINQLLQSDWYDTPYRIMKGDRKGHYVAFSYEQLDEFDHPTSYPSRSFSSACSTIYSLINKTHSELTKVDFKAKAAIANRFPKKHRKTINKLLNYLFEIDPNFHVNGDLQTYQQYHQMRDLEYQQEDEQLAVIIHDGGSVYDCISINTYRREDSKFYQYLNQQLDLNPYNSWSTGLMFPERHSIS